MLKYFKKNITIKIYPVFEKGFHGDDFLIDVVNYVLSDCVNFIETGSAEATTLSFVAKNHTDINCYSCEPDKKVFSHARKQIAQYSNVDLRNTYSPDLIIDIVKERPHILAENTCFWLDAHGYGFEWPLRKEVSFILENFSRCSIFIDDFKVPGKPQFGYDTYEDQECSLEFIADILARFETKIYFPTYSKVTSEYHPLRGWVLIERGVNSMRNYTNRDIVAEYKI